MTQHGQERKRGKMIGVSPDEELRRLIEEDAAALDIGLATIVKQNLRRYYISCGRLAPLAGDPAAMAQG